MPSHDHKTEPIATRDYYALAGIFYSTRTLAGQGHAGDMTGAGYVDPELLVDLPTRLDAPVDVTDALNTLNTLWLYGEPSQPSVEQSVTGEVRLPYADTL